MILIGHTHSSQFMKWKNLVITIRKYATCAPNIFEKLSENQINTDFDSNFLKFCDNISHKLLRPSQLLEKFMEILEWSTLQI